VSWRTDDPLQQQRLGDFVLVREIGRGGMGVVYEATQTSLNRKVALKVLSNAVGLTAKAVQRFHREAEAAAKLHHTNIVPIHTTGEENGTYFYAMELIEGPSLDLVIRQLRQPPADRPPPPAGPGEGNASAELLGSTGPYVPSPSPSSSGSGLSSSSLNSGSAYFDTVARMIADVADALDYAHGQGVIHRDVKPSNLLLSQAGRLSVNDFGLARVLDQPGMTITGEMVGTPRYMSPEQITAGRIPVDHRTDIYSLGATLYELLTLQPPFVAEQRDQLLAAIIQKEPRPPRTVNAKVPVDLETICLKALDKDPDRRYQSAAQMAEDLRRYVNRFAILARRPSLVTRLHKWVKRNRALSAALAAVLVCVAVAAGLAFRAHQAERQRAQEQAKHEAELLEEKRRSAMDKAMLAARLENFEESRQAIREAEQLGCSAGQIRMLQGQLELYQGNTKEAIEQLKQATKLLPESVAAWAMLALAYTGDGRETEYMAALREAMRLPTVTPEDYLFRGHAEARIYSESAMRTLDEAVRLRPSLLAQLVHTEALRLHVMNMPNVEQAKQLMDKTRLLKMQLPQNPLVLCQSVLLHAVCYHVFGEFGEPALRQAALTAGTKDAEVLAGFPDHAKGVTDRWVFLKETGQDLAGVADLRRLCDNAKDLLAVGYYGQFLYKHGKFEQAVQVFELHKNVNWLDFYRVMALAELPDGMARATQLYQEIALRDLGEWDLFNRQLILRFLGDKKQAVAVSQEFLKKPQRFPPVQQEPFRRALEYCAGQCSAEDLIASMRGIRCDLSNAHLCIALTALADRDRALARKHLQLCVGTHQFEYLPYDVSQMLLSRMDSDQKWPLWIK
jgi:serine/threonine protein kinase